MSRPDPVPLARLAGALLLAVAAGAGAAPADGPYFVDRAAASGLDFIHFNGMTGELYFPEIGGQGGALLDYDRDGDLDVYLVQGTMLGHGKDPREAIFPPAGGARPGDRLFRNDLEVLEDGSRRLVFTDVTEPARIPAGGYGMGVTTGDYDGDGWVDLYITAYGSNRLLRNTGRGSFEDVTAEAHADDPRWSTGASFADADGDGDLDLYIVNYVEFSVEDNPACYATSSRRDYCGPASFDGVEDRLLLNRGDGTFADATDRLRGETAGPGLGVVAEDLTGDGRLDFFVANDGAANRLWVGREDGTFRDEALLAGVAFNREGQPEASMGVAAGDADGDGDLDLFVTHLTGETSTLYLHLGDGLYEDRSAASGLGSPSLPFTGFGTGLVDLDHDGHLDLVAVNGAVRLIEERLAAGDPYPLGQRNQLFRGTGGGRFEEVPAERAGDGFVEAEVSRGAAFGDIDNDGDTDILLLNNSGPARLLINQVGQERPWIGLAVVDERGRAAVGARVTVLRAGLAPLVRRVATDGSFASAHDPRLQVGLGAAEEVSAVRVRWPDGAVEEFRGMPLGAYVTLTRGDGRTIAAGGERPEGGEDDDGEKTP